MSTSGRQAFSSLVLEHFCCCCWFVVLSQEVMEPFRKCRFAEGSLSLGVGFKALRPHTTSSSSTLLPVWDKSVISQLPASVMPCVPGIAGCIPLESLLIMKPFFLQFHLVSVFLS